MPPWISCTQGHGSGKSLNESKEIWTCQYCRFIGEERIPVCPGKKCLASCRTVPPNIHVCTNETINGCQLHFTPDTGSAPLVADMSSEILSRPVDFSIYDVVFASAQKNLGPAGVTLSPYRSGRYRIGHASPSCPSAFDWEECRGKRFHVQYATDLCHLYLWSCFQVAEKTGRGFQNGT